MYQHLEHGKKKLGAGGRAGFPIRAYPHLRHPAPFPHQSIMVI